MTHRIRRPKGSTDFVDPEFARALGGRESSARQAERKARQLCRQAQRALNLALADGGGEDGLNELFVEDVSPADGGRLLVHVVVPPHRAIGDAIAALRRAAPRLRSEVAAAITRKRAPELSFVPAMPPGGIDE